MRNAHRRLFEICACVGLFGCGDASTSGSADAGSRADVSQPDASTARDGGQDGSDVDTAGRDAGGADEVAEVIGPEGGTLELGAVRLTVPAGALEAPAEISIRALDPGTLPDPNRVGGAAVDLGPDGQTFLVPVSLQITDPGAPPSGFRKTVLKLDETMDRWNEVSGASFDGERLLAGLSSFSIYASGLLAVGGSDLGEGEVGCTDDDDCQADLVCAEGLGPQFDAGETDRVCVREHCTNDVRDEGEAGVDCGGDRACGSCDPYSRSQNNALRYASYPVATPLAPIAAIAADELGGAYVLASNGVAVQLDDVGNVVREGFLEESMSPLGAYTGILLDRNNELIVLRERGFAKYDTQGNTTWAKGYGSNAGVADAAIDCENNVIVVGRYTGSVNLEGPNELPDLGPGFSGFILKYAPSGDLLHSEAVGQVRMDVVKTQTYGSPSVADCDYYVAGWVPGATDVNFTGDPADLIAGTPGDAAGDAAIAKFDRSDTHQWSVRVNGSFSVSSRVSPVVDIALRDGAPVLFGQGTGRIDGDPIDGMFWGANIDANTGASGIEFPQAGFTATHAEIAFDALTGPIRVLGSSSSGQIELGGRAFELPTFVDDGVRAYFMGQLGATNVQVFEFTPPEVTATPLVMTTTTQGRPVVAGSLLVSPGQAVAHPGGTFDTSSEPGPYASFVVGFEP